MRVVIIGGLWYAANAEVLSISQCADGSSLTTWVNEAVASTTYGLGDLLVTHGLNVGGTENDAGTGNVKIENNLQAKVIEATTNINAALITSNGDITITSGALKGNIDANDAKASTLTVSSLADVKKLTVGDATTMSASNVNLNVERRMHLSGSDAGIWLNGESWFQGLNGEKWGLFNGGWKFNIDKSGNVKTDTNIEAGNTLYAADQAFKVLDNNWDGGSACEVSVHGKVGISKTLTVSGQTNLNGKTVFNNDLHMKGSSKYFRVETSKVIGSSVDTYYTYLRGWGSGVHRATGWSTDRISIWADGAIMSKTYVGASDQRIKKDILPIPDKKSLDILRLLDAKQYKYIDHLNRGDDTAIGFIAQDVQKHLPEAVTTMKNVIPNEMRIVEPQWTQKSNGEWMMRLIQHISPGTYRFKVSTDGTDEETKHWATEDGHLFDTGAKYANVFLYGKEVDDFLAIDKNKIFAVAYSALQQLDKEHQALKQKVALLEASIQELKQKS